MIKKDDLIVCEDCGCKYTLDEAKNLLGNNTNSTSQDTQSSIAQTPVSEPKKKKGWGKFFFFLTLCAVLTWVCFTQPLPEIRENGYIFKMKDDGTYMVHSYTKNENKITVPSSVRGRAVTEIGGMAFKDNHNIKTLIIPESITTIGSAALLNCNSIETLVVPFLGKNADSAGYLNYFFSSSIGIRIDGTSVPDSLKNVYLLDTCTTIGDCAFIMCKNLEKVYIPSSVKTIDDGTGGTVIGINGNTPNYFDQFPFYGCSENLTIYCESSDKLQEWDYYWNYININYSLKTCWSSALYSNPYSVIPGHKITEAIDHSIPPEPEKINLTLNNYKNYLTVNTTITPFDYSTNITNLGYQQIQLKISVSGIYAKFNFENAIIHFHADIEFDAITKKLFSTSTSHVNTEANKIYELDSNGNLITYLTYHAGPDSVVDLDSINIKCYITEISGSVTTEN